MFDHLLRELRNMQGISEISIELEIDDKGYFDRACPSKECGASFKVYYEDWKAVDPDEAVYCPRCGYVAMVSEWNTPDQQKHLRDAARNHVRRRVSNAMERDVRSFNSRQNRHGFITMRMSYRSGSRPMLLPASAAEVMTQDFRCEHCQCRYASVGAAFFCPACGENSILEAFANSMGITKTTVRAIPALRRTMEDVSGKDSAEDFTRHMLENQLVKIVSSFQKYVEEQFRRLENAINFRIRPRLFQSIQESDDIWRKATTVGYRDILSTDEYERLVVYFQQRHILEHEDGFIDQLYIDRSGDQRLVVGQRLVVSEENVLELVEIVEELSQGLPIRKN